MASAKSSDTTARPITADRITVGLIPRAVEELQDLQDRTGMSKTDLVNRAISLYAFLAAQEQDGYELLRRRPGKDGAELELIRFL